MVMIPTDFSSFIVLKILTLLFFKLSNLGSGDTINYMIYYSVNAYSQLVYHPYTFIQVSLIKKALNYSCQEEKYY